MGSVKPYFLFNLTACNVDRARREDPDAMPQTRAFGAIMSETRATDYHNPALSYTVSRLTTLSILRGGQGDLDDRPVPCVSFSTSEVRERATTSLGVIALQRVATTSQPNGRSKASPAGVRRSAP